MQNKLNLNFKSKRTRKSRRTRLALFILAALVLSAAAMLICACNKTGVNPLDSSPCYDMTIDFEGDSLNVTQEILYVAPARLDNLVLHVYANAFDKQNDLIDILSVEINRKTVDYEIYGSDRTLLKLPCSLKEGHTANIAIEYTVTLPDSDTRLGITQNGIANLACFYPVVAKYDNGWREDTYSVIGDPFFHDIASFYVNITVDEELAVAASGQVVETRLFNKNGKPKKTLEIEAEHIRDFAMAAGKLNCLTDTAEISENKVKVNYFYFEDPFPALTLERIKQSLTVFSSTFGDYPYPSFTVAQSNLDTAGGMEYGSFVTVSRTASREEYLDIITHETAHQWWYNLVGNDQINSAWLDEGLTEFSTCYFHYLTGDRAKYTSEIANMSSSYSAFSAHKYTLGFDGTMNRPLSSYLTEGEYVAVSYFKGALMFDTLLKLVGKDKFDGAMKRYFEDNKYTVANETALIAAFKTQGYDISGIVKSWINDTVAM